VALNIDTSRALRTPSELVALVEAIRDAPANEPETDSVEWKSNWDITDAAVRFETARHILGFGNRTMFAAQQQFEGCAYLVTGAEPGGIVGAPAVDPADLDNQLGKLIAPGQPRWSPSYVTVDGQQVLIFTIESPRQGDPIFTLQKGFDKAPAGRIYVRRHGKTEEASPADIRALEARGQAVRPKVELAVTRADKTAILRAASFTGDDLKEWLAAERQRLALPPEPPPRRHDFLTSFPTPASYLDRDPRSKDRYTKEVDAYLARAKLRWLATVASETVRHRLAPLALQIVNPTDRNFTGVEVVVELPDEQMAWMSTDDVDKTIAPPEPPEPWGEQRIYSRISPVAIRRALVDADEVEREGSQRRVRFMPRHVRPGETVQLPPVFLTVPAAQAGHDLTVRWRLTSSGVDGWQEGEISFEVADEPVAVTAANE
jgi:hypothetical protein